ncbi:MAG: NAD(P)H-dependent flavin oxidoreductase [Candidatus Scatomorpha sp.]|jgi:enoyl-[acyl-carrier protein] reductase II
MLKTRLTELVGIKYPIIQAGMGPFPVTSLCIAAANAGCLGLCSTFGTMSRKSNPVVFEDFVKQAHANMDDDDVTIFKKMFTRVFEETKESGGIFGANVMVSAEVRENAANVMKAIKELRDADPEMRDRFRVLVTTAGDPVPWADFVKEQGMIWMHVFPGVRTAARCKKAGVQVLIASGHEGGFHTAWQPVHSMTLLPDIIEKFSDENTLVCGTGGFCDGKSIAAAFAMGADGVQMGTRFLATEESDFCDLWKNLVLDCKDGGTLIARGFVGPARWLRTPAAQKHAYATAKDAPGSYVGVPDDFSKIPMELLVTERHGVAATYNGDVENAMAGAGECAQRIDDLPKTADMVKKVMADTETILRGVKDKYVVG